MTAQLPLFDSKTTAWWKAKIGGAEFKVMRLQESPVECPLLDQPQQCVDYIRPRLENSIRYSPDVENMGALYLNVRKRLIAWDIISMGTLDTLLVHPRDVFAKAILMNAAALVLFHNHPSGDPIPSEADVKVTRDMIRAGQLMKIELLDHIILGRATPDRLIDFCSLRQLGYFYT